MSTWYLDSDPPNEAFAVTGEIALLSLSDRASASDTLQQLKTILRDAGVVNQCHNGFDYLIIGGGTAGLAVASRLAENKPDKTVCVIDAGKYDSDDRITIPGLYGHAVGQKEFDWCYKTIPQPELKNREISSSALPTTKTVTSNGKVLGGSSAINYLVRMRASSHEYDAWSQFGPGWGWHDLLPYFKREEKYVDYEWGTDQIFPGITKEQDEQARQDEPIFRGHTGPTHSTHNDIYTDLLKPTIETLNQLGIKTNRSPSYGNSTGIFNIDSAVDRANGKRSYAANAYIPSMTVNSSRPRQNLTVFQYCLATKILFDTNDVTAVGVDISLVEFPGFPVSFPVYGREVILSTGTYNTPRLLELSGIGNPTILKKYNIAPVVELGGVGENLQEHPFVISDFVVKDGIFTFDRLRNDQKYQEAQWKEYRNQGTGAYATTVSAYGFITLENFLSEEEVQELKKELDQEIHNATDPFYRQQLEIQRAYLDNSEVGNVELIMVPKVFATKPPEPGVSYISLLVSLPHPVARGSVHIKSSSPLDPPEINPQYLSNKYDLKILTKATKFVRRISETKPLSDIIVKPSTPPASVTSDADFEAYVRERVVSIQHPIGTASMAPQSLGGVVDNELRVHGTRNLRIVDMSVAPLHIAAHLLDTAYAIGEKASKFDLDIFFASDLFK